MKMLLTTGGFSPRWRYGRTLQLVICVLALSETTSVLAVAGVDVAKLQPQAQPALQPELQANIQPIQSVHSAKPTKLKETTNSKLTAVIKRPDAAERAAGVIARDPYGHLVRASDHPLLDIAFFHAFVASLSVIIVSELGDKTFFIAAIMAMRHSRLIVFCGALAALASMTVLSTVLGFATTVVPRWFTYYVSTGLFFLFGLKMLKEGYSMGVDEGQEEYDEVQAELRKKEDEATKGDLEAGIVRTISQRGGGILRTFFSRIFIQSFTLTFLAEWGDRSQITTIILGAREDVLGVVIGGTLGHAICTGIAVLGGRLIAQMISIRTVTLTGGVVFIIFALSAFFMNPI